MKLVDLGSFEERAADAAALLRALSNESRLLVLCHLIDAGEVSVGELNARVGLSQSALSQHLAKLRDEGLVATRKEAQTVYYRICDPRAQRMLAVLHDLFCREPGDGARGTHAIGDSK